MKENALRLILSGLFALSVGAAGATFAEVASATPAPLAGCPTCNQVDLTCLGSTCTCVYNGPGQPYVCRVVK